MYYQTYSWYDIDSSGLAGSGSQLPVIYKLTGQLEVWTCKKIQQQWNVTCGFVAQEGTLFWAL